MKLRVGKHWWDFKIKDKGKLLEVRFRYNREAVDLIKKFRNARWNPDSKFWTISNCDRNWFQLRYRAEDAENPYAWYDQPVPRIPVFNRPLFKHQQEIVAHTLTYRRTIIAAEMGTGKTLAAIEAMERSNVPYWWWIGPKSALIAVQREFRKWDAKIEPRFFTYEKLVGVMRNWTGATAPQGAVFDESARIKNEGAQRSQAAMALANGVRGDWGNESWLILMSGAPAPRDPTDWWHQTEVCCPGFITEGSAKQLRRRLALVENRESITGGIYPHLVAWKDSDEICPVCGFTKNQHTAIFDHAFVPGVNEVAGLYDRLKGLTIIRLKKDCLDLPDKQYQVIDLPPSTATLRLARMIKANAERVITALTLLRELSDGFQYQEVENGARTCSGCEGTGQTSQGPQGETGLCGICNGTGAEMLYRREVVETETPKLGALKDLLDQHEDIGRIVIYAAFTGTIDRLERFLVAAGWDVIKVDGRGWSGPADEMLERFQEGSGKIAFLGHPGSAGIGLTLTASPSIVYFSNDFNADSRIQSEDRIHRAGMDVNRGATIYDLVHLPTDQLILDNLKKKRALQSLTLGDIDNVFD